MPITAKELDAKLRKAIGIKNNERKVAYVMSLAQWIAADFQMDQVEKGITAPRPETTTPP